MTPYIVGSKVSINPFAAILALLVGGEIWGAAGMIMALPVIAMLKVIFDSYGPLEPIGFLLSDVDDVKPKKPKHKKKLQSFITEVWDGMFRSKNNKD
ncbi:AI-2E family transporter [Pontibacter rugosus]